MNIFARRLLVRIHPCLNISKGTVKRSFASASPHPLLEKSPWLEDPTYRRVEPPRVPRQWSMPMIAAHVPRPAYASSGGTSPWADIIPLAYPIGPDSWYDKHLEKGVRNACRTTAECLQYAVSLVKQGVTTSEIDQKVTEWALSRNFYPSSLGYGKFPGSLCTSVNNVLAHGVPNEYAIFSTIQLILVKCYSREP